jgi:hypothetical protein
LRLAMAGIGADGGGAVARGAGALSLSERVRVMSGASPELRLGRDWPLAHYNMAPYRNGGAPGVSKLRFVDGPRGGARGGPFAQHAHPG